GRELAALPRGTTYLAFDWPEDGDEDATIAGSSPWSLLTSGSGGLMRWAVSGDDSPERQLRLGPPRQLSPLPRAWFARDRGGHVLGVATEVGGANKILDLETGNVRCNLGVHPDGEVRAISRDGHWTASCGWYSDSVRLWNAVTGDMVHEW